MAGRQGLEPRYADPESAVLPLDDLPAKGVHTILASEKNSEFRSQNSEFQAHSRLGLALGPLGCRLGMLTGQIGTPALELTLGIKGSPALPEILHFSFESVLNLFLQLMIARQHALDSLIIANLAERSLQLAQSF